MKFENWIGIIIAILFGISALTMAMAQIKTSEATDLVLESIIEYENSKVISDIQTKQMLLMTNQLLITNSQQINKNYGCLIAILAERMVPFNKTLYDQTIQSCGGDIDFNITYPNINTTIVENPIKSYSEKIEEIWDIRNSAFWWQSGSIISFILGIFCFILLIELKYLEFRFKKGK